jgi:amino acid permease
LKDSDKIRWAIIFNVVVDFLVYCLCGVFGYLAFLQNTRGDLLESFNFTKWYNILFTAVFLVTIFLTFPMSVFPCRLSFNNLINSLISPCQNYVDKMFVDASFWENVRGFFETLLIVGSGYFLAIFLPEVDVVFSLTGSTASACTSYIFPSLFYIKLTKHGWFHWSCLMAYLLLAIGVTFGVSITLIQILTILNVLKIPS